MTGENSDPREGVKRVENGKYVEKYEIVFVHSGFKT